MTARLHLKKFPQERFDPVTLVCRELPWWRIPFRLEGNRPGLEGVVHVL